MKQRTHETQKRGGAPALKKVTLTENQVKVIKDKYLRDAPSVESWLNGVASNIALAELLHMGKEEDVFKGVDVLIKKNGVGNGESSSMFLLHHNRVHSDERRKNFDVFMKNLYTLATADPECMNVHDKARARFYTLMANFEFLPNSPTLMNAGRSLQQLSACYVLPIDDSIEGWMDAVKNAAIIHKSGGGTGFSACRIRSRGSPVQSTKGVASGALSPFMLIDAMTMQIKQGGTRRGANMGILPYNHPDILEFIEAKRTSGVLENFNISVAITEEFMRAVEKNEDYDLIDPHTRQMIGTLNAKEMWEKLVRSAWETGDPGLIMIDRINKTDSNPTPHIGEIESTNPCGEQPLLPYEPCFAEGTLITTARGLERIENLYEEQERGREILVATDNTVSGGKGITLRKGVVVKTGYKKIITVQLTNGQELQVTPNHQVLTARGWVQTRDLNNNDVVHIQDGAIFESTETIGEIQGNREDLLYGWLSGDGWFLEGERPCAGICFGYDETYAQKTLVPSFREFLNCRVTPHIDKNDVIQIATEKRGAIEKLRRLGFKGGKAPYKEVPSYVLTAEPLRARAYLSALFSADGEVSTHRRRVRLLSASPALIQQVQLLLLNFGITSKISESRADKMARYELAIEGRSYTLFAYSIGFALSPTKHFALLAGLAKNKRNMSERECIKVKAITDGGMRWVYDIHEPVTHSLIAQGIVAHNCNLGSINLSKFVKGDGSDMDWKRLQECVHACVHFLDNVIDVNNYPLPEIELLSKGNRRIGLGVMGWAEALVLLKLPYNSEHGLAKAEQVMKFINDEAMSASEVLAKTRGVFPNWEGSIFDPQSVHFRGKAARPRHCARTTIAPTGTIGITAGLQGAGIEPFFAVVYTRYNAKALDAIRKGEKPNDADVFYEINPLFKEIAEQHNYFNLEPQELWDKVEKNHKSVVGIPEIPKMVQNLFLTSHDLTPEDHVRMQAAFQHHINNAVSKTINFKNEATIEDVNHAYNLAFSLGCKGITIYRDGSKATQVLNITTPQKQEREEKPQHLPEREEEDVVMRIPPERKELSKYEVMQSGACPECSGEIQVGEGCYTCMGCGFSACSI